MGAISPPPNSENCTKHFQVNQVVDVEAKKIFQCKSTILIKESIQLQLLVEPDQSSI